MTTALVKTAASPRRSVITFLNRLDDRTADLGLVWNYCPQLNDDEFCDLLQALKDEKLIEIVDPDPEYMTIRLTDMGAWEAERMAA